MVGEGAGGGHGEGQLAFYCESASGNAHDELALLSDGSYVLPFNIIYERLKPLDRHCMITVEKNSMCSLVASLLLGLSNRSQEFPPISVARDDDRGVSICRSQYGLIRGPTWESLAHPVDNVSAPLKESPELPQGQTLIDKDDRLVGWIVHLKV